MVLRVLARSISGGTRSFSSSDSRVSVRSAMENAGVGLSGMQVVPMTRGTILSGMPSSGEGRLLARDTLEGRSERTGLKPGNGLLASSGRRGGSDELGDGLLALSGRRGVVNELCDGLLVSSGRSGVADEALRASGTWSVPLEPGSRSEA